MDAGKVVEAGPAAQVLDQPQQPRTRRFLRRVEQSESLETEELAAGAGQ